MSKLQNKKYYLSIDPIDPQLEEYPKITEDSLRTMETLSIKEVIERYGMYLDEDDIAKLKKLDDENT